MSEDVIIRAEKLTKTYRLHRKPRERVFSLFRKPKNEAGIDPSSIHHALRDVDLEVRRGEKVAVIGRNGAGKSTLLKIITRAIEPTSGKLDVRGKSHALLSLGVGFHPDFSGRENAYSFLAHMGFAGKKADALVEDSIAFAEIEEYIDQPIKTYSTGMQARLMFAVSTALEPDLLVIDEVLGVGDAYFQNKSFERIRELCESNNTTLLLVSHDIYSAAKLCPRIIWIDQGRVKGDGPATEMLKAYENSIRLQEDARQKQKLALAFRRDVGRTAHPAFIEIRARNNEPAPSPVYFSEATLSFGPNDVRALPIHNVDGGSSPLGKGYAAQLMPHAPWGAPAEIEGRMTRPWNNFGAVEHKAGFVIFPLDENAASLLDKANLSFTVRADAAVDADVVYAAPSGAEFVLHRLQTEPRQWQTVSVPLEGGSPAALSASAEGKSGRQGSGRVTLFGFDVRNDQNESTFVLEHGRPATLGMDYRINDASLNEKCQIILVFRRNGVEDVARVIGNEVRLNAAAAKTGRIEINFTPLRVGAAKYSFNIMIAKERYFDSHNGLFYSINPDVYDVHAGFMEIEVVDRGNGFSVGTGYVMDAHWRHTPGKELLSFANT
jgi:ABC-type polysaccharide/polyol phosphate transport system ATPase subunit